MAKESEFGGRSTPSGVVPHYPGQLTASDKLRLGYRTGQTEDPEENTSTRSWEGLAEPGNSVVDE